MIQLQGSTLKPKGLRVIIEHLEKDKETEGGIIIADTVAQEYSKAMVRYIGDDVTKVAIGDKVLVGTMAGRDVTVDQKAMKLIFEENIEAII